MRIRVEHAMLRSIAVVPVVVGLAASAAASEESDDLLNRITLMEPVDRVGARAAWELWVCTEAAAKALAARVEPGVLEAGWRPSSVRPTPEEDAAEAMALCSTEEARAAGVLAAPEFDAIKASVLNISADAIRWDREKRHQLRRE